METEQQLLPPRPAESTGGDEGKADRAMVFAQQILGVSGTVIVACITGYNQIGKGDEPLFRAGCFSLVLTFMSAIVLVNVQMLVTQRPWHTVCTTAVIVLTSALLMITNTLFVAVMNKDDSVLLILALPVLLAVGMLAGAGVPVDAGKPGTTAASAADAGQPGTTAASATDAGQPGTTTASAADGGQPGTTAASAADAGQPRTTTASTTDEEKAYQDKVKRDADLAFFGATVSFATQAVVITGYLKYPSFAGSEHSQVDLAVSFFASMVFVVAMTVAALPVCALIPSGGRARARRCHAAVLRHLKFAMFPALVSMAVIFAIEFLEWWFMLSLLSEAVVGALWIYIVEYWCKDGPVLPGPRGAAANGDDEEAMVKWFKGVATVSFTLMAGTYMLYVGHSNHDIYLKAAMLAMLSAIVSSLRQMVRPLDLRNATGWLAVTVGMVSLYFPGMAVAAAVLLLAKVIALFYFDTS